MGREARALGSNMIGAPCINLARYPAWGRTQEGYGEDTYRPGRDGRRASEGPAAPQGAGRACAAQRDGHRKQHRHTARRYRERRDGHSRSGGRGLPSGDNSTMCADIGGAGTPRNTFTHTLGVNMAAGDTGSDSAL
jgi:Glycosyl hydrolase family 3 N terminal domain